MKKKFLSLLMVTTMAAAMFAGCGNAAQDTAGNDAATETGDTAAAPATEASADALHLINGKIEIDEMLKKLALTYQEQTGQEVVIESLGGGVDIQATIKSYYQAGNMPDMFVIGGDGDFANWDGMVADLGDCAFAADTDLAYKDKSGTVVGFPYAVEGYGFNYNADILEQAGIDPATLTSYAAYEEAFAKLDSMKDELGIDAVVSCAAEAGQMYWSTANHQFGYYLSGGKDRSDKEIYNKTMAGEIDEARMAQFGKFFNMIVKYSDPQVLISGSYDDQLALWAQGKAAFITQGNWIDASLADYNVTFDCGISPYAFTDEPMVGVLADCPSWWCVYKDGKNVDGCKAFLDWCATSPEGQECFVTECGMVSPYASCSIKPSLPLANSLSTYIAAGNTYAWDWSNCPSGMAMEYTGVVFESYAKGDIDNDGFVTMMASQLKACVEAQ